MSYANWRLEVKQALKTRLLLHSVTILAITSCSPGEDEEDAGSLRAPISYEPSLTGEGASASIASKPKVADLSPEELQEKLETGDIRLIDVRTPEEVAEGRIPGAENIPLDEFDPAELDRRDGREIVLYCRSGRRSGIAANRLAEHDGRPSQHLAGGILAWIASGERVAP